MTEKLLQNKGKSGGAGDLSPCDEVQTRIEEEYSFYCNNIKPVVNIVEVYYGAVPDGLLNEVRNFVGHISVAAINYNDSVEFRLKNVDAAHTHLRRVLLDCYKLMCIYQQDYIKAFNRKFKYYNISDVDDGNFCVNIKKLSDLADKAFIDAKSSDSPGKNKERNDGIDDVYEKYQEAFHAYCDVKDYINKHYEGVIRVATKHVVGKIIGVLGWVITVVLALLSLRH